MHDIIGFEKMVDKPLSNEGIFIWNAFEEFTVKNFVKATFLQILKSWFDEIFFCF